MIGAGPQEERTMDATDLCFTPATELRRLIGQRELSPVDLLEAVLARVEAVDPMVHAFATLDGERALASARAAEAAVARGDALGPLHGLPVSIKDLEPTAGLRTTYGSKFFENHVPDFDGAVTGRVRAAGGIVFGKTNTPNFGHKDMCDNLLGPSTRNPWRLDRTSGASSGGAGAAVASGLGPLAHGSDGAGSIRIPSALCGVFGLKPSFGRVPYWPNGDIWAARSHNGPMTRTVRDAALMLSVIAGPDSRDPTTIDAPPDDYVAACDGDLRGLRVAWSADFGYAPLEPEVRRATEAAAGRFAELGCEVEAVDPGWEDPAAMARVLWHASMAWRHGQRYAERPEWFEPSMAEMIEAGLGYSSAEIGSAWLARSALYERAERFMSRYDLLLTPQMPCVAWRHDDQAPVVAGLPRPGIFDRVPFTFPFNLTGWPAASVPCGFSSDGLPIALQIVAPWHRDDLCLRAAAAFEAMQPWADARPRFAEGPTARD
jgi:Asp-tRNA(Asn)/Glu-tRNA(Gln) amidotransferase A subunit family amidase